MLMEWQAIAEWIGIAAGAVVGLKVLWTLFKKLWNKMGGMFGINELKRDIGCLAEKLDFVVAELHPNGGTSVRDSLNRIEKDLSLANERHRARMLDSPEMIFETDSEGNCVWVNRTYSRGVQRSFVELRGRGWVNGISVDDRDKVVAEWYKAVSEDREFEMRFDFQNPDGEVFTVDCRSYKMRDERTGKAIGYLGHCIKI